jgi:hypothetical protein
MALAGLILVFLGAGFIQRFGWVNEEYCITRQELVDCENHNHWDLWRGTFYCGDKEGRSWFVNRQEIFGNTRLSIPSDQWQPVSRMPYTFWHRGRWQDWYHDGIARQLGVAHR